MDLPDSLPLSDLVATHPDYSPLVLTPSGSRTGSLEKYADLYEGGERFEARKAMYLRPRQEDMKPGYRAARINCAHYTGQMGSIIDWLAGSGFKKNPKIVSDDPYWDGLNEDADGLGQDLAAVLYHDLLETMIQHRAYLCVTFPNAASTNLAAAKSKGGAGDGMIGTYDAKDIDDWGEDTAGQLTWVRIRTVEPVRADFGQAKRQKFTWTYVTPTQMRSYSVERDLKQAEPEISDFKESVAGGSEKLSHDYDGALPIIRTDVPRGLWVGGRLASTQIAIFNADAALAFLYDQNCFQFLKMINPTKPGAVNLSEMSGIWLEPGGDCGYVAPSGTPFEQLRQYLNALEARLYLAVQAMGLQAASRDEHGRQSGVAKQRDMDAAHVLMACYRGRIKDALDKAIKIIKYVRREPDAEIEVTGLEQDDAVIENADGTIGAAGETTQAKGASISSGKVINYKAAV